jgi:hypothetical protein
MCRGEMLDEHERHSRVGRQLREELRQRFEAPGGGAHADDGKGHIRTDRGRLPVHPRSPLRPHTPSETRLRAGQSSRRGDVHCDGLCQTTRVQRPRRPPEDGTCAG